MGQVTLSRFRGDTTYSLMARLTATFGGGVTGAVLWYLAFLRLLPVFLIFLGTYPAAPSKVTHTAWQQCALWHSPFSSLSNSIVRFIL